MTRWWAFLSVLLATAILAQLFYFDASTLFRKKIAVEEEEEDAKVAVVAAAAASRRQGEEGEEETNSEKGKTTVASEYNVADEDYDDEDLQLVGRKAAKTDEQLVEELAATLPRMPVGFLHKNRNRDLHRKDRPGDKTKKGKNKFCARLPQLYDLHVNNYYWQELKAGDAEFFLFGAYLDIRESRNRVGPSVRVLLVTDRPQVTAKLHCQLWFEAEGEEDNQPELVEALGEEKRFGRPQYLWNRKWGGQSDGDPQAFIVTCPLRKYKKNKKVPIAVSLVENECDKATNVLTVTYETPAEGEERNEIAVCVKGMSFYNSDANLSARIVEWLELLRILGAERVFMYDMNVGESLQVVLEYYQQQGLVDLTPLTLSGFFPNLPQLQNLFVRRRKTHKRKLEVVPYNDCLYRNLYKYKHLAFLDVDEVIMPLQHDNWAELIRALEKESSKSSSVRTSYTFRNVYFMDELMPASSNGSVVVRAPDGSPVPAHMHILRHLRRSTNYTKPGAYIKSFVKTDLVVAMHNHFPFRCLVGCKDLKADTKVAHMAHYRKGCSGGVKNCDVYRAHWVEDTRAMHFANELMGRTNKALLDVGLLSASESGKGGGGGGAGAGA